ncbi:hypothetical protein [Kitasatospora sp. NPDC056731]|uniref:hypothetical protein n=1 Tax=Kitasatospora sp. NPDC056731 TaxID=3155422 RepID=UPI00343BEDC7
MEALPIPLSRWRSRTPVRHGHIDKPRRGRIIGPARSTVEARLREEEYERKRCELNPVLAPGMLVIHQRAPFRVIEIHEVPFDLWPDPYDKQWATHFDFWLRSTGVDPAPDPAVWRERPVVVLVEPDGGGKAMHLQAPASTAWDVLPEHYAVCRSCGELPPCREEEIDKATERQMAETLRLLAIRPGACMGCGEAISGRQKPVAFPGPNLWRPDLPEGTARFHARKECEDWVDRYRDQWIALGAPVSAEQPALPLGEGEAA